MRFVRSASREISLWDSNVNRFLGGALARYPALCVKGMFGLAIVAVLGIAVAGPIAFLAWGWLNYRNRPEFVAVLSVLMLFWALCMLAQNPKSAGTIEPTQTGR